MQKAISSIKEEISKGCYDERLKEIYVDEGRLAYNKKRYLEALSRFGEVFPAEETAAVYSAPGRTEVCGNHTDHQGGKVLAASVNLDAIAVVAKTEDNVIRLVSGDYPMEEVDLADTAMRDAEKDTTTALIRGVADGMKRRGYQIGGFAAYVTSDVLVGAGMSSSAAFESLIGVIISGLYNAGAVSSQEIAQIGQYAENQYFGKPCGLMDQMACSVGGMIAIDFADSQAPVTEQVESDLSGAGICLCIVDTKGSHADLTPDYAAVPEEMYEVAAAMGKAKLREVDEEAFYQKLPALREHVSGRALLRAIHFFEEEKRVERAVRALKERDDNAFLDTIRESGQSSFMYLQNIYSPKQIQRQEMAVALAVSQKLLGENGVCRVHGGGFAGTIQVFVRETAVEAYREGIEKLFGAGSCHVLQIRPCGGIRVL